MRAEFIIIAIYIRTQCLFMLEEEFTIKKKSIFLVKGGGPFLSFKFMNFINLTFRVQMIIVTILNQNFIFFSPCNFIAPHMYIILNCKTVPVFVIPWKVQGKRSLLPHILNVSTTDRWPVSYMTSLHYRGEREGKNSCYARNSALIALSVSQSAHNLVTIQTEQSQYTTLCTLHYKYLNMCITKVKPMQ